MLNQLCFVNLVELGRLATLHKRISFLQIWLGLLKKSLDEKSVGDGINMQESGTAIKWDCSTITQRAIFCSLSFEKTFGTSEDVDEMIELYRNYVKEITSTCCMVKQYKKYISLKVFWRHWSNACWKNEMQQILLIDVLKDGSRTNFRVLQNFTKNIDHRNYVICRKVIDSARSYSFITVGV